MGRQATADRVNERASTGATVRGRCFPLGRVLTKINGLAG